MVMVYLVEKFRRWRRTRDFRARERLANSQACSDTALGRYIAVHVTADDTELLEKYRMKPEDCQSVDCYWLYAGDVTLLSVTTAQASEFQVGVHRSAVSKTDPLRIPHLLVVLQADQIDQESIGKAIRQVVAD